jgi:hypothetical protein
MRRLLGGGVLSYLLDRREDDISAEGNRRGGMESPRSGKLDHVPQRLDTARN